MEWHKGLLFRGSKDIKTKGELFRRLLKSYRNKTKDAIKSLVIADRASVSSARLSSFVAGQWEDMPDDIFVKVINSLGLSIDDFKELAKKTAIPAYGIYAEGGLLNPVSTPTAINIAPPIPAPAPRAAAPAKKEYTAPVVKSTNKPLTGNSVVKSGAEIVNHTAEGFIFVVEKSTGKIHIYYNDPAIAKKFGPGNWSYVAPADDVAGSMVPRTSTI